MSQSGYTSPPEGTPSIHREHDNGMLLTMSVLKLELCMCTQHQHMSGPHDVKSQNQRNAFAFREHIVHVG